MAIGDELLARVSSALRGSVEGASIAPPPPAPPLPPAGKPRPVPPLSPARPLRLRGPRGERQLSVSPAPAARADLAALGRVSAENDRRAFSALGRQRQAIRDLRQEHEQLAARVEALEEQGGRELLNLVKGLGGFQRELRGLERGYDQALTRQRTSLAGQAASARVQQVTAAVSSVQAAAFGQRGSLLARNNLLLAGNQLFWTFIDPLLRRLGLWKLPGPSPLGWLAPVGSLLTAQVALGRFQHQRLVSGVSSFNGGAVVVVNLEDRIGAADFPAFRQRTDVPVMTTPLASGLEVRGLVRAGVLSLAGSGDGLSGGRVAWTVDTGLGDA